MGQIRREDPPRTKVRLVSCALQRQVQSPASPGLLGHGVVAALMTDHKTLIYYRKLISNALHN